MQGSCRPQLDLHMHQRTDCVKRSVKCSFVWCNLVSTSTVHGERGRGGKSERERGRERERERGRERGEREGGREREGEGQRERQRCGMLYMCQM